MEQLKKRKPKRDLKQQSIRLSTQDIERLEKIGAQKYRVLRSRAQTIRLLIEDAWKELQSLEVA